MVLQRNNPATIVYCTAADGEKYTVVGRHSSGFTHSNIIWMLLKGIEDLDGDTVNEIYLVDSYYTDDQLCRFAETRLPANAKLIYSRVWPFNNRGERPDKSKCLSVDAILAGELDLRRQTT